MFYFVDGVVDVAVDGVVVFEVVLVGVMLEGQHFELELVEGQLMTDCWLVTGASGSFEVEVEDFAVVVAGQIGGCAGQRWRCCCHLG